MPVGDSKAVKRKTSSLPAVARQPLPSQTPYVWAEKKDVYDKRPPSGWKDTLEQKSASRIAKRRDGLFPYEKKRRTRIEESGWKNITIALPEKPTKVDLEAMSALQEMELGKKGACLRNRGNYCFTCWGVVHVGVDRISCCHCLAVTHKACIVKPDQEVPYVHWKIALKTPPWTCPDCIEDAESNSHFQVLRQRQLYRESMEMFAILKVQAFARMVRYRIDFIFAKIGFTRLQQLFHARKAWTALKSHEEKRPRPFRIRINDVKLFVRSPDAPDDDVDAKLLPEPVCKKLGELGAGIYDAHFRPGKPSEGSHSQENSPDHLLEFLQHGHVEAPEYNTSCKENHPYARGSLFLSVCVHELDAGWVEEADVGTRSRSLRQLYRVDAPLKLRKELKAERITASLISNLGIQQVDPYTLEKIGESFRLASLHIDNPYILIPKCSSSVSVTLTVSQVNVWPRAVVVGQSTQVIKKLLFLHKVAVWHQWLRPGNWADLPEADEGRKLLITLSDTTDRREQRKIPTPADISARTAQTRASSSSSSPPPAGRRGRDPSLPCITSPVASPQPKTQSKIFGKPSVSSSDSSNDVFGGVLTWSLLTMTNENQNEGGYLFSVPRGAGERGILVRREVWCVLVDKCFLNYVALDNIKPRLHADLKQCFVTPMADGIFRIDGDQSAPNSFKTLFFMGKNRKEGARWFWKLYSQSASNSLQKYSGLNFQPGGEAVSFAMTRAEREEVGLGSKADKNNAVDDDDVAVRKLSARRIVPSQLALLRADPMMAFVYQADCGSEKSHSSLEGPARRRTMTRMMKTKRTGFADLITRTKSCAEGIGESKEEGAEEEWVGQDLSAALAAALNIVENSPSRGGSLDSSSVDKRGRGASSCIKAAVGLVELPVSPLPESETASLSSTPRGLSPLQRVSREGKKAHRVKALEGMVSGANSASPSRSRLAKFSMIETAI